MSNIDLQRASRARNRAENLDPHLVAFDDGKFALHIQYGGGAVIVDVGRGSQDIEAFREWVEAIVVALPKPEERLDEATLTRLIDDALSAMDDEWTTAELAEYIAASCRANRFLAPALAERVEEVEKALRDVIVRVQGTPFGLRPDILNICTPIFLDAG